MDDKRNTTQTYTDKPSQEEKLSKAAQEERALSVVSGSDAQSIGGRSGIPSRKSKTAMKDFILSTLNKNKAEGCYVAKKGGPQKEAQPMHIVN